MCVCGGGGGGGEGGNWGEREYNSQAVASYRGQSTTSEDCSDRRCQVVPWKLHSNKR